MTALSAAQYEFLTGELYGGRVRKNDKGFSHLEAWDVRRHLIRAFGFDGFDITTKDLTLVREIEHKTGDRSRWTVVYRAEIRLTIKVSGQVVAVFEDGAAGDSCNQPSLGDAHDMAMKTALSQALKRCAVNLGDQFGLSLYNGGQTDRVVRRSLVTPDGYEPTSGPVMPADDVVLPDPEDRPSSCDQAPEETRPVSDPGRLAELDTMIAAASDRDTLGEVWKAIVAAERSGQISAIEAARLAATWQARKVAVLAEPEALAQITDHQMRHVFALLRDLGVTDRGERLALTCEAVGRQVASGKELTAVEGDAFIAFLKARKAQVGDHDSGWQQAA